MCTYEQGVPDLFEKRNIYFVPFVILGSERTEQFTMMFILHYTVYLHFSYWYLRSYYHSSITKYIPQGGTFGC